MFCKINISCVLFLLLAINGSAQETKIIRGTVQDVQSQVYIQGAYITVSGKKENAISNGEGGFSISVPVNSMATDSLVIDALGYTRWVLPLVNLDGSVQATLQPVSVVLPEITVSAYHINWSEFMARLGKTIKESETPFESDMQKTIDISVNAHAARKLQVNSFSHYEGLNLSGFTSYLRGLTLWYAANNIAIGDTAAFIDCNESGKPQVFTDFDRGKFQWLYLTHSSTGNDIAEYHMEQVTVFGEDSVYVVKYIAKPAASNKDVRLLNNTSDNGIFTFFSADKTYYVRKKDYRLIRIDFFQSSGHLDDNSRKNISSIDHISGSVGLQYFDNTPHPAYIYEQYVYNDVTGNRIERNDSLYFSNIKMIKIPETELKKKYQAERIYRSYPIRDIQLNRETKLGAFWYVPVIKK